jgi:PQQ enzyme repeat
LRPDLGSPPKMDLRGKVPRAWLILGIYDVVAHRVMVLFISELRGDVYAVDARSGAFRWKCKTGDVVHSASHGEWMLACYGL